jgi:hypothetical protein
MTKTKISAFLLAAIGLCLTALPAFAHHSFQAEFDGSKLIYVTGTLTKFDWENPHIYFYMDVKDADGKVTPWVIEGASPNVVKRTGSSRQDFIDSIGKSITVRACPSKNGTPRAAAETIKVPDGRELVVGGKRYSGDGGGKSEY